MSLSDAFNKFKCEKKFIYYFPKPSYHPQNKDILIMSTQYSEESTGIYEYNTKNNSFNKIYTYNQTFQPYHHGQFIVETELLYIFGDKLGVFDLNTKLMDTSIASPLCNCEFGETAYIPSPINECHILTYDSMHYKMDMNTKTLNKKEMFKTINVNYPNILYIPFTQQLLSFGSHFGDEIWYCNVKKKPNKQSDDWHLYHLKMPHSANVVEFDVLLAFEKIVFIFYFMEDSYHGIWCVDLLNNKLIKTSYNVPIFTEYDTNTYVVKDSSDYGHIINFVSGEHYTFNLYNFIPKEVSKLHENYYKPIINGYIKEQGNNNNLHIPDTLKLLILSFFPLFT